AQRCACWPELRQTPPLYAMTACHGPGPQYPGARRVSSRQMHFPARSAAREEKSWTPASAPESGRTCAFRARRWPSSGSWLQPRTLRHDKGVSLDQFVSQLAARVVDEDIVERSVLDGKRFDWNLCMHRAFDQLGRGARAVAGENPIHAGAFRLDGCHCGQAFQPLLDIVRRMFKLHFNYIRSGHAGL